VNIFTNKLVRILGKVENTERFLQIALFQGIPKTYGLSAAAESNAGTSFHSCELDRRLAVFFSVCQNALYA
jgi:hypothetical protein